LGLHDGLHDTSGIPIKDKNKKGDESLMTNDSFIKSLAE